MAEKLCWLSARKRSLMSELQVLSNMRFYQPLISSQHGSWGLRASLPRTGELQFSWDLSPEMSFLALPIHQVKPSQTPSRFQEGTQMSPLKEQCEPIISIPNLPNAQSCLFPMSSHLRFACPIREFTLIARLISSAACFLYMYSHTVFNNYTCDSSFSIYYCLISICNERDNRMKAFP